MYMAGLLTSLFQWQQHSSGWIFHGAFAALARGPRRGATDQDDVELLKWAETYWNRQTPSSFADHSRMFANFPGTKFRLETREQATILLADLRACVIALKGEVAAPIACYTDAIPMHFLTSWEVSWTQVQGRVVVEMSRSPAACPSNGLTLRSEVTAMDQKSSVAVQLDQTNQRQER